MRARGVVCAGALLLVGLSQAWGASGDLQTPEQFLGHAVGADYRLARWEKIVGYFRHVAERSDRVNVRELGPTTEGFWIPEGASDELGMWGYVNASAELKGYKFDALIHAVGSGGTSAGLVAGRVLHPHDTPLVGVPVCDDADFFHDKIDAIFAAARERWRSLPELPAARDAIEMWDGHQGEGYALNRPAEWSLLREVAQTEGVVLDPVYTLKAMMGLRQAIRDGRFTRGQEVCFLHTGGIYGLFPKREESLAV